MTARANRALSPCLGHTHRLAEPLDLGETQTPLFSFSGELAHPDRRVDGDYVKQLRVSKKALDLGHGDRFTLVGAFGWINASRNNAELDPCSVPCLFDGEHTEPAQHRCGGCDLRCFDTEE